MTDAQTYQILYDFSSVPTIRKFALCDDKFRLLMGPFSSGKSTGCVHEVIRRAHNQTPGPDGIRRTRWAIVRNTYSQLRDTTIKTFFDWYPPSLFGEYNKTDHNYYITKFPGVLCEVMFRALDRPDQISNLLSLEVTGAWFNEVREIPKPLIDAMDSRVGRYPSKRDGGPTWHGIFMDTNPPDEGSWIYKTFEQNRPEGWSIFKQPSGLSVRAENIPNIPVKNYYLNLAKGKDEMYIRVYIHGQYGFMISGKPVFGSFKDNVHVAPRPLEPIKGLDVIVGLDFGLTPAAAIGQITPLGQLRIIDELVSEGMGIERFAKDMLIPLLQRRYFGSKIVGFGDPAGSNRSQTDERTCYQILQSPDIGLHGIEDAQVNDNVSRVGAVESFLNKMVDGEPGFLLSPNCQWLRKAMNGAYHYEKDTRGDKGDETYKLAPVKNFYSHIADSLQYLCLYVTNKEGQDKRWKSFQAHVNMPGRFTAGADNLAGY